MARADRRSARRAKQTPGIRARGQASAVEQTLFFSKIRRRAKWVFVFLTLAFGLGFVIFGVGSDVPGGVADILQGRGATDGPSIEDAREKLEENPRDAAALKELSDALQAEGRVAEAIDPLERYLRVRPRDEDALVELANLYEGRGTQLRNEAGLIQARLQELAPERDLLPPSTTPLGQALANRPVTNALVEQVQGELNAKVEELQAAYRKAQEVYERLIVLQPDNASLQLDLGDAALNGGDTQTALAAYREFVKQAPDDPQVPLIEDQIKRLEGAVVTPSNG
jgi:tetratricopeptide (TPR) repeat protein